MLPQLTTLKSYSVTHTAGDSIVLWSEHWSCTVIIIWWCQVQVLLWPLAEALFILKFQLVQIQLLEHAYCQLEFLYQGRI